MDHTVVLQLAEVLVCLLSVCVCVCARLRVRAHSRDSLGGDSGAPLISQSLVFLLKLSNGCTTQTCAYLAVIY